MCWHIFDSAVHYKEMYCRKEVKHNVRLHALVFVTVSSAQVKPVPKTWPLYVRACRIVNILYKRWTEAKNCIEYVIYKWQNPISPEYFIERNCGIPTVISIITNNTVWSLYKHYVVFFCCSGKWMSMGKMQEHQKRSNLSWTWKDKTHTAKMEAQLTFAPAHRFVCD